MESCILLARRRVPHSCGARVGLLFRKMDIMPISVGPKKKRPDGLASGLQVLKWLRGLDLNQRPSGYEFKSARL